MGGETESVTVKFNWCLKFTPGTRKMYALNNPWDPPSQTTVWLTVAGKSAKHHTWDVCQNSKSIMFKKSDMTLRLSTKYLTSTAQNCQNHQKQRDWFGNNLIGSNILHSKWINKLWYIHPMECYPSMNRDQLPAGTHYGYIKKALC